MTELSFLIDLLINPRDPEQLKKDLAERIKEVEVSYQKPAIATSGYIATSHIPSHIAQAAPQIDPGMQTAVANTALMERAKAMAGEGNKSLYKVRPK